MLNWLSANCRMRRGEDRVVHTRAKIEGSVMGDLVRSGDERSSSCWMELPEITTSWKRLRMVVDCGVETKKEGFESSSGRVDKRSIIAFVGSDSIDSTSFISTSSDS